MNEQKQFSVGQVVRLNSGSPSLTVVNVGTRVTVQWMTGNGIERCEFPSACLTAL